VILSIEKIGKSKLLEDFNKNFTLFLPIYVNLPVTMTSKSNKHAK